MTDITDNNEERLSAYFDNELSPEQQREVTAALAADPELRKTLSDFEILREEFQSLPVVFHPDQAEMLEAVITKVRAENLSVQDPPTNVTLSNHPSPDSWKQKVRFSVLLTLTAAILAVVTMQFLGDPGNTTLVKRNTPPDMPAENIPLRENQDLPSGSQANDDKEAPEVEKLANADKRNNSSSGNRARKGLAANGELTASKDAEQLAGGAGMAMAQSIKPDSVKKLAFPAAPVAYHIQVERQDLEPLINLLNKSQSALPELRVSDRQKTRAPGTQLDENAPKPEGSTLKSSPRDAFFSTNDTNQIFVLQANMKQLNELLVVLDKNPSFSLSRQVVQGSVRRELVITEEPGKNKISRTLVEEKSQKPSDISNTLFSIQVVPPKAPAKPQE